MVKIQGPSAMTYLSGIPLSLTGAVDEIQRKSLNAGKENPESAEARFQNKIYEESKRVNPIPFTYDGFGKKIKHNDEPGSLVRLISG